MLFSPFKINVLIMEKRGDAYVTIFDKARRLKDKSGVQCYELKKKKDKLPAPEYQHVHIGSWLYVYSPNAGEYHPMTMKDGNFTPVSDKTMNYFYATQLERNIMKFQFKSTLDKFLPLIMVVATGFIIALMLYMSIGKINEMYGRLAPISNDLKETLAIVQQVMKEKCSIQTLPGPPV